MKTLSTDYTDEKNLRNLWISKTRFGHVLRVTIKK